MTAKKVLKKVKRRIRRKISQLNSFDYELKKLFIQIDKRRITNKTEKCDSLHKKHISLVEKCGKSLKVLRRFKNVRAVNYLVLTVKLHSGEFLALNIDKKKDFNDENRSQSQQHRRQKIPYLNFDILHWQLDSLLATVSLLNEQYEISILIKEIVETLLAPYKKEINTSQDRHRIKMILHKQLRLIAMN
ncbi:CLUMA_CG019801, isoform A [Clunio marinus]|uniref:CLUMA_CG019801, isoform A n=1 Tax=Clunio marinus TaxID=568069 RepID=A0A1J1J4I3_9DIPT|nr:CLUMA_CG019801, isoform A [Clunio marinus]